MNKKIFISFAITILIIISIVSYYVYRGEKLAHVTVKIEYPEKHLVVAFSTNDDPDKPQLKLEGYYIYIANGKEIKKDFTINGGLAWNFSGDYIKEVNVRNIGQGGSYQIWVTESKKTIFSTNLIEHFDSVNYVKK